MVVRIPGPTIISEHQSHFSYNKITLREDGGYGVQTSNAFGKINVYVPTYKQVANRYI